MSGFEAILVPDDVRDAVSDRAWLAALLEAERALANAEAIAGAIPAGAAAAIADRCRPELFDAAGLAEAGRGAANPVEPLVRELAAAVGGEAAAYVHWGATSQDIMDTAAMLVSKRALGLVCGRLDAAAERCAELARAHRATAMAGRTLLQHAVPTTFGLKCAVWLVALMDALDGLERIRRERLAAQLGGAAGTLAALGDAGLEAARLYAHELDLSEPQVPWHADRQRIAELGAALAAAAGVAGKIAGDIVLLSQTEVGEVAEGAGGASSTMPQKRNPAASVRTIACARQARGHASVLLGRPRRRARARRRGVAVGVGRALGSAGVRRRCGGERRRGARRSRGRRRADAPEPRRDGRAPARRAGVAPARPKGRPGGGARHRRDRRGDGLVPLGAGCG